MSTMPTIPMISPDGTIGDIPVAQASAAAAKGFQIGKEVDLNGQKGVIPFSRYGDFMKEHGPITGPQPPQAQDGPKGFLQSLVAPIPQAAQGLYHAFTDAPRNEAEARVKGTDASSGGIANALGQFGLGAKRVLVDPTVENVQQAVVDARSPYDKPAVITDLAKAIPLIGGGVGVGEQALRQKYDGDTNGAAGTMLGNLLVGGMAEGALRGVGPRGIDPVGAPEVAARSVAQAINPGKNAFAGLVDAVQTHGGDLRDYIRSKNLEVGGVLGYGKAARALADETYQKYRGVLDPVKEQIQRVPEGFGGELTTNPANPAFSHATLDSIDRRIGDINKLTRNADTGKATIESDRRMALEAEHAALTDTLHSAIAKYTKGDITPDDVAALRQKFGKLNTIADLSEGAVNARSGTEANASYGANINAPHSATGAGVSVLNKLLRGPANAIADSSLRKAGRSQSLKSSNLKLSDYINDAGPVIPQVSSVPRAAPIRGESSVLPTFDATPDLEAARAITSRISTRNAARDASAAANRAQAIQEFLKANDLEKSAQDASAARAGTAQAVRKANTLKDYLQRTGGRDYRER